MRTRVAAALLVAGVALLLGARGLLAQSASAYADARREMVRSEIVGAGIKDERVVRAIGDVPRHEFVALKDRPYAYYDMAMAIGEGQTISPPFIVAYMTEQLEPKPTDVVLEIGTGSGYQAAVLSPLVKQVYTIEIVPSLGRQASATLKRLGYRNVTTKIGDGYQGWAEHAPFDKIIVTCSPEKVPQPLIDQLRDGGRLIVPLGERYQQMFYLFRKENGQLVSEALRPTLFVPMTGTAEENREVQPDRANPAVVNGGFEDVVETPEGKIPKGWHYARQCQVTADPLSPEGSHFMRFTNTEPGRGSQALQGFGIDGRQVKAIDVSLRVRANDVRPGMQLRELPIVGVTFFDVRQNIIGEQTLGPWHGTFSWQSERGRFNVPPAATHAIVRVGLLGAVGELDLDELKIAPAAAAAPAGGKK